MFIFSGVLHIWGEAGVGKTAMMRFLTDDISRNTILKRSCNIENIIWIDDSDKDAFEKASDMILKSNAACATIASDPKHVHAFNKSDTACRPGFLLEVCACGSKRLLHRIPDEIRSAIHE